MGLSVTTAGRGSGMPAAMRVTTLASMEQTLHRLCVRTTSGRIDRSASASTAYRPSPDAMADVTASFICRLDSNAFSARVSTGMSDAARE